LDAAVAHGALPRRKGLHNRTFEDDDDDDDGDDDDDDDDDDSDHKNGDDDGSESDSSSDGDLGQENLRQRLVRRVGTSKDTRGARQASDVANLLRELELDVDGQ
jgi:hypothetical protein